MRWMLLLTLASGGCVTVGSLESDSLRHLRRADYLAQIGDGEGAARERDLSVTQQEKARLRAAKRGSVAATVLLR